MYEFILFIVSNYANKVEIRHQSKLTVCYSGHLVSVCPSSSITLNNISSVSCKQTLSNYLQVIPFRKICKNLVVRSHKTYNIFLVSNHRVIAQLFCVQHCLLILGYQVSNARPMFPLFKIRGAFYFLQMIRYFYVSAYNKF